MVDTTHSRLRLLFRSTALAAGLLASACGGGEGEPEPGAPGAEVSGSASSALVGQGAQALAVGIGHGCALLATGGVKCWGEAEYGQLGLGDQNDRGDIAGEMGASLPLVFGANITAIAAHGETTCALELLPSSSGTGLKCWGRNGYGQLGLGDTASRGDNPGEMASLGFIDLGAGRSVKAVSLGYNHTCAILDNDQVKCWGYNLHGELGIGDTSRRGDGAGEMGDTLPVVNLGTGRTAKAIAAGDFHTCAILDTNEVKCWGNNVHGQLGLGDIAARGDGANEMGNNLPVVNLGTGRTAKAIAAGGSHTCAILDTNEVKCWGNNASGQLGHGNTTVRGDGPNEMGDNLPVVNLGTGRTAKAIDGGSSHTCAILDNDQLKCWGYNLHGELGIGDTSHRGDGSGEMGNLLPTVNLGTGRTAKAVAGGYFSTCALLDTDEIKCWGAKTAGMLGTLGCSGTGGWCGDQAGEMGDALAAVDLGPPAAGGAISVDGCGSAAIALYDTPVGQPIGHELCLSGTGTLDLAAQPRPGGPTWAGAVKSFRLRLQQGGGLDRGGLLSPSTCATWDCPSHHVTAANNGLINANAAGQAADSVTLYALKAPLHSSEVAEPMPRFVVSDHHMGLPGLSCTTNPTSASCVGPNRTFVWSAERYTDTLAASNPNLIVGHYTPLAAFDTGSLYPRCEVDADCKLPGYHCILMDAAMISQTGNPELQYHLDESVCVFLNSAGQSTKSEMRTCTTHADCRVDINDPNSEAGVCSNQGSLLGNRCLLSSELIETIKFNYWNDNHPDWILRKCAPASPPPNYDPFAKQNAAWWGSRQIAFDFTNEAVVQEVLRKIRIFWNRDYDALSVDVVNLTNQPAACRVYSGGTWIPKYSGTNAYSASCSATCSDPESPTCLAHNKFCDWRWTRDVSTWLKRLRDEMHKDGKRLHVNMNYIGYTWPIIPFEPSDPTLQGLFDTVDGVFDEEGFNANICNFLSYDGVYGGTACPNMSNTTANFWSTKKDYMTSVQDRGKPYYVKTNLLPLDENSTVPAVRADTGLRIDWALASYMMADKGLASLYVEPFDLHGNRDYTQLHVDLGAPCGDPIRVEEPVGTQRKAYMRRYERGFAVVNFGAPASSATPPPTAPAGGDVTVALPTVSSDPSPALYEWNPTSKQYNSLVSGSSVTVSPLRGKVLFKPAGASLCN
ncbi:RCC1 domain-containing protein [Sorangium sp. So ce1078]|uniref:RCC1 domain-containing protein n=1 Tax=Sorangium sp. So ce1078 TaxID=3133329 RepID=UPI003F5F1B29